MIQYHGNVFHYQSKYCIFLISLKNVVMQIFLYFQLSKPNQTGKVMTIGKLYSTVTSSSKSAVISTLKNVWQSFGKCLRKNFNGEVNFWKTYSLRVFILWCKVIIVSTCSLLQCFKLYYYLHFQWNIPAGKNRLKHNRINFSLINYLFM